MIVFYPVFKVAFQTGEGREGGENPLCPSDISPKYDKGELGCEFIVWLVGFGGELAMDIFAET
jgi:hypothetical protein